MDAHKVVQFCLCQVFARRCRIFDDPALTTPEFSHLHVLYPRVLDHVVVHARFKYYSVGRVLVALGHHSLTCGRRMTVLLHLHAAIYARLIDHWNAPSSFEGLKHAHFFDDTPITCCICSWAPLGRARNGYFSGGDAVSSRCRVDTLVPCCGLVCFRVCVWRAREPSKLPNVLLSGNGVYTSVGFLMKAEYPALSPLPTRWISRGHY